MLLYMSAGPMYQGAEYIILHTHIYICIGNATGCDQTPLLVLITEYPPGLCRIAGMAGIQIKCYLGS